MWYGLGEKNFSSSYIHTQYCKRERKTRKSIDLSLFEGEWCILNDISGSHSSMSILLLLFENVSQFVLLPQGISCGLNMAPF
jgi:hypothetical protein